MYRFLTWFLLFFAISAQATEGVYLNGAAALYKLDPALFADGALLYRQQGTNDLDWFDMSNATIQIIIYGPPYNCARLVISAEDGTVTSDCYANTYVAPKAEKYNAYGELEFVDPDE